MDDNRTKKKKAKKEKSASAATGRRTTTDATSTIMICECGWHLLNSFQIVSLLFGVLIRRRNKRHPPSKETGVFDAVTATAKKVARSPPPPTPTPTPFVFCSLASFVYVSVLYLERPPARDDVEA